MTELGWHLRLNTTIGLVGLNLRFIVQCSETNNLSKAVQRRSVGLGRVSHFERLFHHSFLGAL